MEPLLRSVEILKRNREFARFEISFMIYGMGFIMMMMAVPIFLVDVMKFNYTTSFFAKAILAQIGIFLLSPFMGSLHDKKHPSNFAVISFGLLSLYPGILLISQLIEPYKIQMLVVFAGFFIFGIARAADMVVWNMGSVYFAQNEDSSMYQSIHVTLMGIRGVAAPLLGVVIKKLMDTNGIFIFSAFFFIIASIYSYFSYKKTNFYLKGKN
ncbi:MAG: multidrug efflux MFS transporter [Candidatus Mcinerneyibacterium aminivorans]|uniref:Multidrug efflux MFS transporter n=1 Tax=Candidatus Mcinerneyibacterium aminivorans TaxID=2703815 RepID=A0A5D0MIV0_9BACT|nr:MAG: multidrug efflux MFS transporter [Candidatus Mcinerneyibacterium aminivorans]